MSDKLLKQPMAHTLDDCQNWSCPAYSKEAKTCIAGTNPLTCMRYLMDQTRQAYFDEKKAYRTETELNATKLVGLLDIPSRGISAVIVDLGYRCMSSHMVASCLTRLQR